ncbi:MAG: tyrosine-type recombinase/integrase [Hyphomicrobiaceae bacterium]
MARYRAPLTVGLPFERWPALHQQAWCEAIRDGDLLSGRGPAAHWKPKTRCSVLKAVGNYLRFERERGRLIEEQSVAQLLTEDTLRAYIAALRRRLASQSVVTQLGHLSMAIWAMTPDAGRALIKLAIARLTPNVIPGRKKTERLVLPTVLLQLGLKLMADWQVRRAHDPRLNAMDYRDGLMIAFLALCPMRLQNLAQMQIGLHLRFEGDVVRVAFEETKGDRPLEFDWPAELRPALDFYLSHRHPMLYDLPQLGAPLWPSLHRRKPQMGASGIYTRITRVTEAHLGLPVNPHLFRDAAATFITDGAPERAHLAAGVLHHTNLQMTKDHYIRGQQHQMLHRYRDAIDALIAEVAAEPLTLFEE